MKNIEDKITLLIEPSIANLGYELYDVEYNKRGKDNYLSIFIDSVNGIGLEDCEKVTNEINEMLDEADYIKDQYFLEVSSPGLERILRKEKHLVNNIDNEIEISLYTKVNNSKSYNGTLKAFTEKELILSIDNVEVIFDRNNISQIKLKYNWENRKDD